MSHKLFDNNLVAIRKSKLVLKLNKPAYIGMCFATYEFHYDYIRNKYDNKSKLLFTNIDSLMYEIKTEDVYEDFTRNKKMFESKYYDNSNKSVIGKMKDEAGGVAIEEFVGLKPKMYLFLVDNSQHKKARRVNRNIVAAISHNEIIIK